MFIISAGIGGTENQEENEPIDILMKLTGIETEVETEIVIEIEKETEIGKEIERIVTEIMTGMIEDDGVRKSGEIRKKKTENGITKKMKEENIAIIKSILLKLIINLIIIKNQRVNLKKIMMKIGKKNIQMMIAAIVMKAVSLQSKLTSQLFIKKIRSCTDNQCFR